MKSSSHYGFTIIATCNSFLFEELPNREHYALLAQNRHIPILE